jgi:hypothetical protein
MYAWQIHILASQACCFPGHVRQKRKGIENMLPSLNIHAKRTEEPAGIKSVASTPSLCFVMFAMRFLPVLMETFFA